MLGVYGQQESFLLLCKEVFCLRAGVFRGCDRDLLVLSPTAHFSQQLEKWAKEPEETKGFFTSLRAMCGTKLQLPTSRSRDTFDFDSLKESPLLLRRCR